MAGGLARRQSAIGVWQRVGAVAEIPLPLAGGARGGRVAASEHSNVSLKFHRHPGLVPGSNAPQAEAFAAPWMPDQVRHDEV